jgi:hypothetical protein
MVRKIIAKGDKWTYTHYSGNASVFIKLINLGGINNITAEIDDGVLYIVDGGEVELCASNFTLMTQED